MQDFGKKYTLVVDAEVAGARLDRYLADCLPHLSRSFIQKLINGNMVMVEGVSARASRKIKAGERIEVSQPPPVAAEPAAEDIPLDIVFEDSDILVLCKPAGLVVHPAPGSPDHTLVNALLHHCEDLSGIGGVERPGIVHRLDRNTSGLLVVTKNDLSHRAMSEMFQNRQVQKTYLAFAGRREGGPTIRDKGTFDTLYGRHPVHRKRFSSKVEKGKQAVTDYEITRRFTGRGFEAIKVRVTLHTGRTHQIRVHFADAGYPLLGDKLYGGRSLRSIPHEIQPPRQALHAWRLCFEHPVSRQLLEFEAPLPNDLVLLEQNLQRLSGA